MVKPQKEPWFECELGLAIKLGVKHEHTSGGLMQIRLSNPDRFSNRMAHHTSLNMCALQAVVLATSQQYSTTAGQKSGLAHMQDKPFCHLARCRRNPACHGKLGRLGKMQNKFALPLLQPNCHGMYTCTAPYPLPV
jgi:hypothetical protein